MTKHTINLTDERPTQYARFGEEFNGSDTESCNNEWSDYELGNDDEEELPELIKAASKNDINSVQNLIESGEDINQTDDQGSTALHIAAYCGHI
jgi:ankyrin repeat protein